MEELYKQDASFNQVRERFHDTSDISMKCPGFALQDFWLDINAINSQAIEAVGYATQKPEALLERILKTF